MRPSTLTILLSALTTISAAGQPCVPFWSDEFSIGPAGLVYTLAEFDEDGPGPLRSVLVAGGYFSTISNGIVARNIARYDGASWSQVGPGLSSATFGVIDLAVFDEDGEEPDPPRLFVAGDFNIGSTIYGIARWDGISFTRVGTELTSSTKIAALHVWDDDGNGPNPPALYAYGAPRLNGTSFRGVLKWNGAQWSTLPFAAQWSSDSAALIGDLIGFDDDGGGPTPERLYLCGPIADLSLTFGGVARWTGETWEIVGGGLGAAAPPFPPRPYPESFAILDEDGDGPAPAALFVSGAFGGGGDDPTIERIARWNGQEWSAVGDVPWGNAWTVAAFDPDGPGPEPASLYSGIDNQTPLPASADVRRWTGSEWALVGRFTGHNSPGMPEAVELLPTVRNGTPALLLGGNFLTLDGAPARSIATLVGCAPCPGDLDGNHAVDLADLSTLLAHFGTQDGAALEDGDLDADGDVDISDLAQLLARFGSICE